MAGRATLQCVSARARVVQKSQEEKKERGTPHSERQTGRRDESTDCLLYDRAGQPIASCTVRGSRRGLGGGEITETLDQVLLSPLLSSQPTVRHAKTVELEPREPRRHNRYGQIGATSGVQGMIVDRLNRHDARDASPFFSTRSANRALSRVYLGLITEYCYKIMKNSVRQSERARGTLAQGCLFGLGPPARRGVASRLTPSLSPPPCAAWRGDGAASTCGQGLP